MPTTQWTRDDLVKALRVAQTYEKKEAHLELRKARIILEGDIKARIVVWDEARCIISYGKAAVRATLPLSLMKFKYVREKKEEPLVSF